MSSLLCTLQSARTLDCHHGLSPRKVSKPGLPPWPATPQRVAITILSKVLSLEARAAEPHPRKRAQGGRLGQPAIGCNALDIALDNQPHGGKIGWCFLDTPGKTHAELQSHLLVRTSCSPMPLAASCGKHAKTWSCLISSCRVVLDSWILG
jgi:hypothetical protein